MGEFHFYLQFNSVKSAFYAYFLIYISTTFLVKSPYMTINYIITTSCVTGYSDEYIVKL
jgi:hypothetical protein